MAKVNVADAAVAQAALTALFKDFCDADGQPYDDTDIPSLVAQELISGAARVRFQPSTRQLVLTFDLAFGDQPDTQ